MYSLWLSLILIIPLVAQPIDTIYGTYDVTEPVLLELLQSDAMRRIQHVEHTGIGYFVRDPYRFTRYDHCVGVWIITRIFGAEVQEQVAALLHDASHTAFSHVGDMVFDHHGPDSYQDAIHESYIKQTDAYAILQKYDMSHVVSDAAKETFNILEQDLPDLCADRIEYNLHAGLLEKLFTQDDVMRILSHIHYDAGRWFFDDIDAAYQFGMATVCLTRDVWGSAWNGFINQCCARALKRALQINLITLHDMHFGTDQNIWDKLIASSDQIIAYNIACCKQYDAAHEVVSEHDVYDYYYRPKCRAVNPWITTEDGFKRLTELRADYADAYQQLQDACKAGYYIRFSLPDLS